MQTNMNISPSFQGQIKVSTFTKAGKEVIKHFPTTPAQDALIKRVSNSMSVNGILRNPITNETARDFTTLIETITGKKLRVTRQEKFMTNMHKDHVSYGDAIPENGGVFVKVDFKA